MTKIAVEGSDCVTGKHQDASREEAERAAKALMRKRGWTSIKAYHCPHCDLWHIGNDFPIRKPATQNLWVIGAV
jgi:hypothetical protein